MAIYNSVLAKVVHIIAVIGKNPTGTVVAVVEGVFEVIIIVVGLDDWIIDVSGVDLEPAYGVGVALEQLIKVDAD